jgi:glycosyltransferase involved in cell wall biosynthesis
MLSTAGFKVTVVTSKFNNEKEVSEEGDLTVYRLPLLNRTEGLKYATLLRLDILFSRFMRRLLKRADIVYIPRLWYSAIPLAKSMKKPVLVHLHDYIPICPLSSAFDVHKDAPCSNRGQLCSPRCIHAHERMQGKRDSDVIRSILLNSILKHYPVNLLKLCDTILFVSKMQRKLVIDAAPSLGRKALVMYNPLPDVSRLEINGNDFGYFGGLDHLKGFHILCRAIADLERFAELKSNIQVTRFPTTDSGLKARLMKMHFVLHGKLEERQYELLYKHIRAVIVPSVWHEPLPYVVSEAIMRGRFVIASRVGGIPEQIEGCRGTILYEAENHKALAEALGFVSDLSPEEIVELGFQNREVFLKRFDNETILRKFINLCERLV